MDSHHSSNHLAVKTIQRGAGLLVSPSLLPWLGRVIREFGRRVRDLFLLDNQQICNTWCPNNLALEIALRRNVEGHVANILARLVPWLVSRSVNAWPGLTNGWISQLVWLYLSRLCGLSLSWGTWLWDQSRIYSSSSTSWRRPRVARWHWQWLLPMRAQGSGTSSDVNKYAEENIAYLLIGDSDEDQGWNSNLVCAS